MFSLLLGIKASFYCCNKNNELKTTIPDKWRETIKKHNSIFSNKVFGLQSKPAGRFCGTRQRESTWNCGYCHRRVFTTAWNGIWKHSNSYNFMHIYGIVDELFLHFHMKKAALWIRYIPSRRIVNKVTIFFVAYIVIQWAESERHSFLSIKCTCEALRMRLSFTTTEVAPGRIGSPGGLDPPAPLTLHEPTSTIS